MDTDPIEYEHNGVVVDSMNVDMNSDPIKYEPYNTLSYSNH